jgi:lipopolysaccharide/colanic/teichoic acid biosynthesis glycosyltransferase
MFCTRACGCAARTSSSGRAIALARAHLGVVEHHAHRPAGGDRRAAREALGCEPRTSLRDGLAAGLERVGRRTRRSLRAVAGPSRFGPRMAEVRDESRRATRAASPPPAYGPGSSPEPSRSKSAALLLKHVIDRIVAACGLIVTAPLLVAVALGLRRASGRVLRREERIGEGGRMIVVRSFAITDDLRRGSRLWQTVAGSGISALPQLWSVLRGDMSVIGPRPRDPGLHAPPMRPGLTGLAQLEQLQRWLAMSEQLELDEDYARTWSLGLDVRIVWRTLWFVLR